MASLKEKIAATLGFLKDRKKAYMLAFRSPAGQIVLKDLIMFCRGAETPAVPGDRDKTMLLLGRHEVFIRIQQHLNLSDEELFALYAGKSINMQTED